MTEANPDLSHILSYIIFQIRCPLCDSYEPSCALAIKPKHRVCQKALTEYVLHVDILFVVIKAVNKSSDSNWRRSEREDSYPMARRVYLRVWEHACVILESSLRS